MPGDLVCLANLGEEVQKFWRGFLLLLLLLALVFCSSHRGRTFFTNASSKVPWFTRVCSSPRDSFSNEFTSVEGSMIDSVAKEFETMVVGNSFTSTWM